MQKPEQPPEQTPEQISEERRAWFARRRAENKSTLPLKDGPITRPDPPNLMGKKRIPIENW